MTCKKELRTQPGNKLKNAEKALKMLESRPTSFEECVVYGRLKFDKYFRNKILQLLHNFPLTRPPRRAPRSGPAPRGTRPPPKFIYFSFV